MDSCPTMDPMTFFFVGITHYFSWIFHGFIHYLFMDWRPTVDPATVLFFFYFCVLLITFPEKFMDSSITFLWIDAPQWTQRILFWGIAHYLSWIFLDSSITFSWVDASRRTQWLFFKNTAHYISWISKPSICKFPSRIYAFTHFHSEFLLNLQIVHPEAQLRWAKH